MRPSTLAAVTVEVDPAEAQSLRREWVAAELPVPLVVLDSPYRDITEPIMDYIARLRRQSPRELVAVVIPEYVVGHWWEGLLHNQSALRLKQRLRLVPNVMVISVPYQLAAAADLVAEEEAVEAASASTLQAAAEREAARADRLGRLPVTTR